MNATGIDLSFIAFFSLLLSLGLLVDDTIVVISALTSYYRSGKFTPLEAALLVWRDFKTAILTTTLTTVWAFVPLLLSTGIIGEFIKPIPIVVSSTLLGSLIVAVFITMPFLIFLFGSRLPHRVIVLFRVIGMLLVLGIFIAIAPKGAWFLPTLLLFVLNLFIFFQVRRVLFRNTLVIASRAKQSQMSSNVIGRLLRLFTPRVLATAWRRTLRNDVIKKYVNHGVINFEKVERNYRRILESILKNKQTRRKTVLVVVIFSLFSYFLLPLGFVRNEFFPPSDQEFLYAS
ncbi:efflux RND transporter permease subunit, partial [Candidatus Microgenomates bacterium]|nr:efflux RND transporter permease subunit [Candidatus Microgenomates bacterium]